MSKENVGIGEPSGIEIPGLDLTGLPSIDVKSPEELAAEKEAADKLAADKQKELDDKRPPAPPPTPPADNTGVEDEEDEEEGSLITDIAKKIGYEFEENETYEDTEDGLAEFVLALGKKQGNAELNQYLDSLPPVAGEFFDFLSMGGKPEDFFAKANPEIDYKKVDLTQPDIQKSIIRTMYRKLDYEDTDINGIIDDMILVDGMLEKQAKLAANRLQGIQEKERQQLILDQQEQQKTKQREVNDYWAEVQKTIQGAKVKGFEISKTEQKDLLEYMSKPVKNGLSQFSIDSQQLTIEDRILYAKMVKNKFNLDGFVKAKVTTQNATALREKIAGAGRKMKSAEDRSSGGGATLDIGLHNMGN
jgi:hypothetical protein